MDLTDRWKNVKLLALDVDGVLTDGRIIYDSDGRSLKFFNVHDGMGLYLLRKANIDVAFISAKSSPTIKLRARDCGVSIVMEDISDKGQAIREVAESIGVGLSDTVFMGDDLVDIPAMRLCGLAVAVANACPEVKEMADYVTSSYGGRGAVREVCELILKSKGLWDELVQGYTG